MICPWIWIEVRWGGKVGSLLTVIEAADPDIIGNRIPQLIQCLDQIHGNMSFINTKWLNFLGLSMPTTVDEFEQVLMAFRDNAASIKAEYGIDGDIIPMSCIVNNGDQDPSILINGFGEGYGDADKDRHIAITMKPPTPSPRKTCS